LPWEEEFAGGTDGARVMKATDFHKVLFSDLCLSLYW